MHAEQLAISVDRKAFGIMVFSELAVLRPVNQWSYGQTDMAALAAAYAFGLARNHAFVDGNKRELLFTLYDGLPCASNDVHPSSIPPGRMPRPSSSPSRQAR